MNSTDDHGHPDHDGRLDEGGRPDDRGSDAPVVEVETLADDDGDDGGDDGGEVPVVVVTPVGEFDVFNSASLKGELLTAVESSSLVVVDLSRLASLDSTVLAVLVAAQRRAIQAGSTFRLAGPAPAAARLLHLTSLEQVLPVFPSRQAALTNVDPPAG